MTIINISLLCFLILINVITPVLTNKQCSADIEGNDVVSVDPYKVREIGGDQLVIDLPCQSEPIDEWSVKCKFQSYPESILDGIKLGDHQVACVTPAHVYLGIHEVHVSVDNGTTFGYVGSYSVVNKKVLKPRIVVQNSAVFEDFTTDKEITLLWEPNIISSPYLTLKLMVIVDPFADLPRWDQRTILIEKVENNGKLTFIPSNIVSKEMKFLKTPLTLATYQLTNPNSKQYITGPNSVIAFSDIAFKICELFDPLLKQLPRGLIPCPCNTAQANTDTNYTIEASTPNQNFFHPGVDSCYRSIPSPYGSSEQCCYNTDGGINVGTDGSGTADTYSPEVSTVKHAIYDVLTWFACCKIAKRCDYYSKYRPTDDCGHYKPSE